MFKSFMDGAFNLFDRSISSNTKHTYNSGWKAWIHIANLCPFDPLLQTVPVWFPLDSPFDFKVSSFLIFIVYSNEISKLNPSTITNYISAIKFNLERNNVCTKFVYESTFIKKVLAGSWNVYRSNIPEADTRTLPITTDMFIHGANHVFNSNSPLDQCTIAALAVARSCLLRASETIPGRRSNHFLRSQDIEFEVSNCNGVSFIKSFCVKDINEKYVTGVNIIVRSAKNDQSGSGHKIPFINDSSVEQSYNLTIILFRWAKVARLLKDQAFFTYQSTFKLTYIQFNKAHKDIAKSVGFDTARFSCKSSRVGGACALAYSGFPDSYIMIAGRWSSSAFLKYLRVAVQQYSVGLDAISDPSKFTLSDMKRLLPSKIISDAVITSLNVPR